MNRYIHEVPGPAEIADCGNPDLVHVYRLHPIGRKEWVALCDASEAPDMIAAMELRDRLLPLAGEDALRDMQVIR